MAKKGIYDVEAFLLRLKVERVIDDVEKLTEAEKVILKNAFEEGKQLQKVNPELADELERAVVQGDLAKVEKLTNTTTRITGDALAHEVDQGRFIGDYLGGGEFNFINSKKGIEGFLTNGPSSTPISLKEYTSDRIINIFRKIRDNAKHIADEAAMDSRIVIGADRNSVLFADIVNFDKAEVLEFLSTASTNTLPSGSIFERVIFRTKDGQILLIPTN